jgi:hypothetical protein
MFDFENHFPNDGLVLINDSSTCMSVQCALAVTLFEGSSVVLPCVVRGLARLSSG